MILVLLIESVIDVATLVTVEASKAVTHHLKSRRFFRAVRIREAVGWAIGVGKDPRHPSDDRIWLGLCNRTLLLVGQVILLFSFCL